MTASIEPRTLADVRGVLNNRRDGQKALLDKYPEISGDEVKEIQRLDQEINDLADRERQLVDVERIRADVAKAAGLAGVDARDRRGEAAPGEDRVVDQTWRGLGKLFTDSPAYKGYKRGMRQGPTVEVELSEAQLTALLVTKATLTTVGAPPESMRLPFILPGALRRPTVASLIPQGSTTAAAVKYLEETTTTNAIAATAEGATKPELTLGFTERTAPVRKIAGILKVTDETLEDQPLIESYLNTRLQTLMLISEEDELINGDNTAPHLNGLITASTNTEAKTAGAGDSVVETFYRAMTKIRLTSFLEPSGGILHPTNWQSVQLMKTTDGIYIWGSPADPAPQRLWGVPVVVTPAMAAGTGQVGAYDTATLIARRSAVSLDIATENEDDWRKNIVAIRVEERLALLVFRPLALCDLTGLSA